MKLTAREDVAPVCRVNVNSDALVTVRVVEGAADGASVRLVVSLCVCVVYYESDFIRGKSAVYEHVVSAVVDTAEKVFGAEYIRKFVILAEIGDVYTRARVPYMAI